MRLKYFLALSIVIYSNTLAQNCKEGSLAQQPGLWTENTTGSISGIPAVDLAAEKKIVAALHTMIKSKYIPTGVNVAFNGAYDRPYSSASANAYRYCIYPLNLYCDGAAIKTAHETSTYFSVSVNAFDIEIYEDAPEDHPIGYFSMDDIPIEKEGCYYFPEKDASLGFGMTGKSSMWLITYNKKLPFSYVAKSDFLLKRKQILSRQMEQSASGHKDVLNGLEIEKKYKEAEYKGVPDKMQKYLKMDYTPRKERYEKLLADNEKSYKGAFEKIEVLLKMSATELTEPAIVRIDPDDHLSYLFTDDKDPFGEVLIKPNPVYFNKNLARSAPQFMTVYVVGNHKEPVASTAMAGLAKAVDLLKLKSMLGK